MYCEDISKLTPIEVASRLATVAKVKSILDTTNILDSELESLDASNETVNVAIQEYCKHMACAKRELNSVLETYVEMFVNKMGAKE